MKINNKNKWSKLGGLYSFKRFLSLTDSIKICLCWCLDSVCCTILLLLQYFLIYEGDSINKVTRPLTCVMFLISFKFPARSEQVEHCFLSRTLDRASYQSYCPNISCKMAGLAQTWSNIEVLSVGTLPAEIHRQRVEVYGANVMSRKHVWVWCTAFDNGRTDVQDEQRSGRPSTATHSQPHAWVVNGAKIERYWTILPTALTWHRVIFISLDHWKSTWVEGDSQRTVKFSKPCPGFRRLTPISSMLG
jgi:hypothetical protein